MFFCFVFQGIANRVGLVAHTPNQSTNCKNNLAKGEKNLATILLHFLDPKHKQQTKISNLGGFID
jgi:hypothetical protein